MELARMIAGNNRASVMGIKVLLLKQMAQNLEQQCGRLPDQGPRCAAGILRLPGGALEALTNALKSECDAVGQS
jgi:hypothetical protein